MFFVFEEVADDGLGVAERIPKLYCRYKGGKGGSYTPPAPSAAVAQQAGQSNVAQEKETIDAAMAKSSNSGIMAALGQRRRRPEDDMGTGGNSGTFTR
jgi:hypothetical protein